MKTRWRCAPPFSCYPRKTAGGCSNTPPSRAKVNKSPVVLCLCPWSRCYAWSVLSVPYRTQRPPQLTRVIPQAAARRLAVAGGADPHLQGAAAQPAVHAAAHLRRRPGALRGRRNGRCPHRPRTRGRRGRTGGPGAAAGGRRDRVPGRRRTATARQRLDSGRSVNIVTSIPSRLLPGAFTNGYIR